MTQDQALLFFIIITIFGLLLWGRWRYDLIAFSALTVTTITGLVSIEQAFSGFSHPAVVIIALIFLISRGLSSSGAIELITHYMIDAGRSLSTHIAIMSSLAATLSATMNNIAALTLLIPVDIKAANKAKRSPAWTLMPLSFASILGGMITLIGTPSNIVIATFREKALGEPYLMFDFTPVGLTVAITGIIYISTIGWHLIPISCTQHDSPKELHELSGFIAESFVSEKSSAIGKKVYELYNLASEHDVHIIGLIRNEKRLANYAHSTKIENGDILVLEATSSSIEPFIGAAGLEFRDGEEDGKFLGYGLTMSEAVVMENAIIAHRSAKDMRLFRRYGITLLGVSRQGQRFREHVGSLAVQPGDLLLLLGRKSQLDDVINQLGCLPIAESDQPVLQRKKAKLAVGMFAAAIFISALGLVHLTAALACCVILYGLMGILSSNQIYDSIEWPAIILLGSLIPIGAALESSGGTVLIAETIVNATSGAPISIVLAALMILTMMLSDLLNNVATALIAAPIGVDIANELYVNPDTFLMAVAVASSCAFLTPIGHKNNILILGPGGYRFSDFWRIGLPLEILVLIISLPMILIVWPL